MSMTTASILAALDRACDRFVFPMLDNGYIYLAATRLTAYRSETDWAIVAEVFGFSPRAETPDVHTCTVASRLHDRKQEKDFRAGWYEKYLRDNPDWEQRFMWPIDDRAWQDPENPEYVSADAMEISVRGKSFTLPSLAEYGRHGIDLLEPPRVMTFELCRWLAAVARDEVLSTPEERRANVPPELAQFLQLEEWHHPDLVTGERPSGTDSFRLLADAIVSGNAGEYRPTEAPNTHWRNWPEGGLL
jgi:hypothetical protein